MARTVDLPVGQHPGWELQDKTLSVDGSDFLPIAESLVLLQSLKQSRDRWLTSAFPRLPKGRGSKQVAQNVPLHEYKAHDKFELSVGPSIFSETALFEVVYTTDAHTSSATPSGFASPELINMVSAAEASNPELKLLLDQIRTKPAYDADYKRLGELLQSMFPEHLGPNATSQNPAARQQKWDLVIEFREKPTDRWIFPRGLVQLGRAYDTARGKRFDVMISTMLPYTQEQVGLDLNTLDQQNLANMASEDTVKPSPVTFHWKGVTSQMYNLLTEWSLQPDNWEHFKSSNRMYLPHQLPEGELLGIIRAALAPTWTLKSIKPANADSSRAKRRGGRRKATVEKAAPAATALDPAPFTWPPVPPPLNIVQVQPGPSSAPPAEAATLSPSGLRQPSTPQTPASPSLQSQERPSARRKRQTPSLPQQSSTPSQQPARRLGDAMELDQTPAPSGSVKLPVAGRRSRSPRPSTPTSSVAVEAIEPGPPSTRASASNASNASSPEGSPAPSADDGSDHPNKRRKIPPKSKFSHPLPSCKTCGRTGVQLLHAGQFCRMCIDIHRPQPPPPQPTRPQYSSSSSYHSPSSSSSPYAYPPPHSPQPYGPYPYGTHAHARYYSPPNGGQPLTFNFYVPPGAPPPPPP